MTLKKDLIALKDQSELMLELAHSAMFLHDKAITKRVEDLYFNYQKILNRIKKKAFKDEYVSGLVVNVSSFRSKSFTLKIKSIP